MVHPEKSVLIPTQEMEFLGVLLNSINITIRLPPAKGECVQLACQSLLDKSKMIIREVAQVIGLMVSSFPAIQFGELYYRALEGSKFLALQESRGNYDAPMYLSNESTTRPCYR